MNFRKIILLVAMLGCMLTACSGDSPAGGTYVWIDVPLDGITVPEGQQVKLEGHASNPNGTDRVEVFINGQIITTLHDLSDANNLSAFEYAFTPPQPGEYIIQVVAYAADGEASETDSARIIVGQPTSVINTPTPPPTDTPTPIISITPEITHTFTPTPTPTISPTPIPDAPVVNYYAYPPEIGAGDCSRLIWHVENVQSVVFGGVTQAFDGSYEVCLCENTSYPLTVTYLDGSSERIVREVIVTGTCATPVPEDTTPPPIPQPQVPSNGLAIACKASQNLAWLPVDDPSGISGYKIEVQRQSGDNNWQAVTGSPFGSTEKSMSLSVECGWYYRWRVKAIDSKGNQSNWSSWFQFSIQLS